MDAYAVVKAGGKPYMVKPGDKLEVETIEAADGASVELAPVLAVSDGAALKIGTPYIDGVKVHATVLKQIRGPKLVSFKKKRRKGYTRKVGHRQALTVLKIDSIQ